MTSTPSTLSLLVIVLVLMIPSLTVMAREDRGQHFGDRHIANYMITGATGTIGKAVAAKLANIPLATLILVSNDFEKCEELSTRLKKESSNPGIRCAPPVDLSNFAAVDGFKNLFEQVQMPLHALILAHATVPSSREETSDGFEKQFATNVLGTYWMMTKFAPVLQRSIPSRIIVLASEEGKGFDPEDPMYSKRAYDPYEAYLATQEANRLISNAMAERLSTKGVTVNAVHPCVIESELFGNLDVDIGEIEPIETCVANVVNLATSDDVSLLNGKFFVDGVPVTDGRTLTKPIDYIRSEKVFAMCGAYSVISQKKATAQEEL